MSNPSFAADLAQRHLDAAYNLGRWMLGNEQDAADAVHDAFLRATRSAQTYAGGDARAWWLAIVRNCCLAIIATRQRDGRLRAEQARDPTLEPANDDAVEDVVETAQRSALLAGRLRALPARFREVLVLREMEDLSYREIADVLGVPIGTVMSRLARGRALLQRGFEVVGTEDGGDGL